MTHTHDSIYTDANAASESIRLNKHLQGPSSETEKPCVDEMIKAR